MFPYVSLTFSMAIGLKVAVYDNDRELVCKQTVPKLFALRHLQCHAFFQEILIREFLIICIWNSKQGYIKERFDLESNCRKAKHTPRANLSSL